MSDVTTSFTFSCDPPHVGIHGWLFQQTRYAQMTGAAAPAIRTAFRRAFDHMLKTGKLRRAITDRDIDQALKNIFATIDAPATPRISAPMYYDETNGWPQTVTVPAPNFDHNLVDRALVESPVKSRSEIPASTGSSVCDLFAPADLLCVGKSASDYRVFRCTDITHEDISTSQFVVPNPLRKRQGRTKEGRLTSHCRDATGPRKYIIYENDHGLSVDDQIACIFWLAQKTEAEIACITMSGGKSVHAWYRCHDIDPETLFKWFALAIRVGADSRLFLPDQFVRMPGGYRPDKQARQEMLYCQPSPAHVAR